VRTRDLTIHRHENRWSSSSPHERHLYGQLVQSTDQWSTYGTKIIVPLLDLVGKALTPRLRDLTRVTLVRDETPTEIAKRYPHAGRCAGMKTWWPTAGRTCCGWPGR
jgi:hypothetical protein